MLIHGLNLLSVYPNRWNLTSSRSIARRRGRVSYLFLSFLAPSTELGHIVGVYQLFDIKGQEAFRAIFFFSVICKGICYYCYGRILQFQMLTYHSAWHLMSMQ